MSYAAYVLLVVMLIVKPLFQVKSSFLEEFRRSYRTETALSLFGRPMLSNLLTIDHSMLHRLSVVNVFKHNKSQETLMERGVLDGLVFYVRFRQ